ncbi:hypothetical protein PV325_010659 [Microctonus aethiopoides]|uniref:PIH1 domain-containing protein 1 n=1 Tax=Microctonus aethiopoides TaxID=144406 RepID=A0AA39FHA7_9HYME|nr:hypothetical protein PV325_010659 [Microctonus aethiopoides]KAK0169574.1 hypothetical protein PV328_011866 [Microctonus aethiopoides]
MPNNILDVDESIIRKNLLLPERQNENDQLDNLIKTIEGENIPSIIFRPTPGICIKARTDNNEKVFINLCHTTDIPPPEDISDEKFYAMLDEEPPSWCIPMSVGHERFESSKDGTKCLTYDIAINTNYFKKIQSQKHFLTFTILTIISAIESKHDKNINSNNYVVLKNRKVTGTLHDHRVQKREVKKPIIQKPLIEEIEEKIIDKNKNKNIYESKLNSNCSKVIDDPKYVILLKNSLDNKKDKKLIGFFKLPNQCCVNDVDVNVNDDRIVVEAIGFNYLVDIFVPYFIKPEKVVATMESNFQILRLEMPVVPQ